MAVLEDQKKRFTDLKLNIYSSINSGDLKQAMSYYNEYILLYKTMISSGSEKENLRLHADTTRLYNKLRSAILEKTDQSDYNPRIAQTSAQDLQEKTEKPQQAENIKATFIETDFDILLNIIGEKGKMKLDEIEQRFAISKKLAEEWVQILADHDLVDIRYLPVGGVEVTKALPKKAKKEEESLL